MEAQIAAAAPAPAFGRGLRFGLAGDERLGRMVAEGNEAAFATLYGRYHQPLYRLCRTLVGNDHDAQDALQSAFTGALVALREGRRDAPLRPWLFRIAHNESISLLRRRRPEQELPDELPASSRSPHEAAEERARLATLMADLRELPDRQRSALVMRELSGLPHEEVAVALGISVGAAKQTVLEARRSLAEFTEGRAMVCEEVQRTISDGDRRMLRGRRIRAHLRDCSSCRGFATAIPVRKADLLALTPALPAVVAGGLLARISGGAAQLHGGGSGGAGLAAGAAGKGLGTVASVKLLAAGAAVVAGAAGAAGVVHHFTTADPVPQPAVPALRSGSAAHHAAHPRASRVAVERGRVLRKVSASHAVAADEHSHRLRHGAAAAHRHHHAGAGQAGVPGQMLGGSSTGTAALHGSPAAAAHAGAGTTSGRSTAGRAHAHHHHLNLHQPVVPRHRHPVAAGGLGGSRGSRGASTGRGSGSGTSTTSTTSTTSSTSTTSTTSTTSALTSPVGNTLAGRTRSSSGLPTLH